MIHLVKVVSGGQTGADQAGLRAARALGLQTGGWAPRDWRTQNGSSPWLADFGLVEHSGDYGDRTDANVLDSDATVRFARYWSSPGEIRTLRATAKHGKPCFDVTVPLTLDVEVALANSWFVMRNLALFLVDHRVCTLNVAGNAEHRAPGVGIFVERFLVDALRPVLLARPL